MQKSDPEIFLPTFDKTLHKDCPYVTLALCIM